MAGGGVGNHDASELPPAGPDADHGGLGKSAPANPILERQGAAAARAAEARWKKPGIQGCAAGLLIFSEIYAIISKNHKRGGSN